MRQMFIVRSVVLVVCLIALATGAAMAGISGTFVKADSTNTTPTEAVNWGITTGLNGYDLQWGMQVWGNVTALTSAACFDPGGAYRGEDCPQLTTTVNGLDPAKTYEIYVQFLGNFGGNWAIYANLPGNARKLLTINNSVKSGAMWDGFNPICEYKLGTVTGANSFAVNVDDYTDSPEFALSMYYGVSYKEIPTRPAGISGTFVKADTSNTGPASAIAVKDFADGYDGMWTMLPWGNVTAFTSYAKFDTENNIGEDCPVLTTTVSGLDPAKTYEIYVQALIHLDGFWGIYAGLPGQSKMLLTKSNTTPTGLTWDGTNPISEYRLGVVSGVSTFSVEVDDYNSSPNYTLSEYYGVSYKEVTNPKPIGPTGTFVKASASNTGPDSAIDWTLVTGLNGYDAKWGLTVWGDVTALSSAAVVFPGESYTGEDCPQLTTTINGLNPAKTYNVYAQFLAHRQGNWALYANMVGQPAEFLYIGNSQETGWLFDGTNPICEYKLGTVSGVDSFSINVDDFHNSPAFALSMYYGVSYEDVTPFDPSGLPVVGIANKSVNDTAVANASTTYQFKVWGRVTILDGSSFMLDDGSGNPVTVNAPSYTGITEGCYASATGVLVEQSGARVLNAKAADVLKLAD